MTTGKNNMGDIVPPKRKRSIKDIPVPPRKKTRKKSLVIKPPQDIKTESVSENEDVFDQDPLAQTNNIPNEPIGMDEDYDSDFDVRKTRSGKGKKIKIILITIIVLLILIGGFFVASSFDSAVITITPKTASQNVELSIEVENNTTRTDSNILGYRVIELATEVDTTVAATEEELVQEKASGIITVFNEYSDNEQKLIKNTRFESEDGKIYRIQESVTVPGYTESGDQIVAGSVDVEVFADEVGEQYNVESSKFTVPGFQGQDQFDFFYAEIKTSISGGFDGVRKIISEEEIASAKEGLSSDLTAKLINQINEQVTSEFIAVFNPESFTFGEVSQEDISGKDEALLKLSGSVKARVFDRIEVSNFVAKDAITDYSDEQNVLIESIDNMDVGFVERIENIITDPDSEIAEEIILEELSVSGSSDFVWQNDVETIKNILTGSDKDDLGLVVQNSAGIVKAETTIKPFWRSKFPNDADKIEVKVEGK